MSSNQSMAEPVRPQPRGISKNLYFVTIAVVAVVGFVAGTRSNEVLAAIGPVFGVKVVTDTLDLSSVQKTYQTLEANFDGTLDKQALIDGASRGLAAATGDKYTAFMDAKEATEFDNELSGDIGGGVGAEIGVRDDKPTVVRVLEGNPAEKAGVKAGDVIIGVNDEPSSDWTADKTAGKIRGEVGTTVKLTLLRGNETKEFTITRAEVNNPSVQSSVKDGIGTLTVTRFDDQTGELARRAAEDFKQKGVKKVILDLRDNGGGYVTAAQDVAGLWLKNEVVVTERTGGKVVDELKSGGDPVLAGVPTVVLVNGNSASASEIVAGALKDHHAATLVGEKTFGKGTVQKVIEMNGGAVLKVTVARWYTPGGRNIDKEGIEPDKTVKMTADDVNDGRDPQMKAARGQLDG